MDSNTGAKRKNYYRRQQGPVEIEQEKNSELFQSGHSANGGLEESVGLASRKGLDPSIDPDVALAWGPDPRLNHQRIHGWPSQQEQLRPTLISKRRK